MGEAARGPIDLLRRFGGVAGETTSTAEDGDDAREIELSLGLSLGGWYSGAEKRRGLVRASSIASIAPAAEVEGERERERPLMRTCSLPAEAEEEVRRRKEMQMLRRMEAKRKRSERREMRTILGRERAGEVEFRWGGSDEALGSTGVWKRQGGPAAALAKAQSGSQGSSSGSGSGADLHCASMQAWDISANAITSDAKIPWKIHSSTGNVVDERKTPISPNAAMVGNSASSASEEAGNPSKEPPPPPPTIAGRSRQVAQIMMEQMPCVFTRGHGTNGKRIEGFLYKYGKGEDVRIVCVCHGDFLTPAEFVKHAGGGDVDHPLRHIVVNPSPLTLH